MAVAFQPSVYNQLPSLEEAQKFRSEPHINDLINGPIRDLFLKYASNIAFCLYLQHRHHKLVAGEAIVKVGGTAHLMDNQQMRDIESFGNDIVPTTWMTSNGSVIPMEFASVRSGQRVHAPTQEFMAEFAALLHENGCDNLFGIDTIAATGWSELTIGDASVVVPCDDKVKYNEKGYTPVAFSFLHETPTFIVHGRCGVDHRHQGKPGN